MKTRNLIILLFLAIFFVFCAPTGMAKGQRESSTADGLGITARGSVGQKETVPSGPMYTGNGGNNIRLAVLAPEVHGDVPAYLPSYIQGLLNNNIKKFSAINLIDRQNLNSIIAEQNLAASGRFSDKDFISIGNLTNAQYYLFGTVQRLSGNRYSLQLSVTEVNTGIRKASFMKDGTSTQFEGNGAILNEATAELLEQLGIQLTAFGKQALLAGNTSTALSEAGLARGITAQAGGAEVKALLNFAQAITFDPSQLEALSRLNTLSTSISGGTISQRIVNDIKARDRWLEVFKETTHFFNEHPPFEIIFDPSLIQIGETDFIKRTANLGMNIALNPSEAGFNALNTLLEGLKKTGRRTPWGFSNWPLTDITPKTSGTVLFDGKQTFTCKVDVSLLNDKNKILSKSSITLNSGRIQPSLLYGTMEIQLPESVVGTVNFLNVKSEDLTPVLTIVITAVNGIPSARLNTSGYMKIDTGDVVVPITKPTQTAMPVTKPAPTVRPKSFDYSESPSFLLGYNYAYDTPHGFTIALSPYDDGPLLYTSFNFDFGLTDIEWVFGGYIPIIKRHLMIPIGIGGSHSHICDEYSDKYEGFEYKGQDKEEIWEHAFVMEIGLQLVILEYFYLSSTYRLIDFSKNSFTIGVGLIF